MTSSETCGCDAGAFGSMTALVIYLFGSVALPIIEGRALWASWSAGAVALVGGGVIGKLFWLLLARRRLSRLDRKGER